MYMTKMDASLCIGDLNEVVQSLKGQVTNKWMSIGLALGLRKTDLDNIEQDYNSLDRRLQEMLTLWLKQSYDTSKYGPPSWNALIKAVGSTTGGGFPSLAAEIAADKQPQASSTKPSAVPKKLRKKRRSCTVLPPLLKQVPVTSKPAEPVLSLGNICRILIFNVEIYLGAIFHRIPARNRFKEVEMHTTKLHNATLEIVDNRGIPFSLQEPPDLVLLCIPLISDETVKSKAYSFLRHIHRTHNKADIWNRVVITFAVPSSIDLELYIRRQEKRRAALMSYISSLRAPKTPPIMCVSENLTGNLPGDPDCDWYSNLWTAIFESCSKNGRLALMTYLSDRLTDTPSTRYSPQLQKIPREAADKAKTLAGSDYLELVEKR